MELLYNYCCHNVGSIPVIQAFFGPGSSRIHLDGIHCSGNEATLLDCPSDDMGTHDCTHSEDAGVICTSNY